MAKNIDCTTSEILKLNEINIPKRDKHFFYESLKENLKIEDLYKLALHTYKEKEELITKSVGYNQRTQLAGYIKQISKGNFIEQIKSNNVGLFNVVGKDRNEFWKSLKNMSKEDAMLAFTDLLMSQCPSLLDSIKLQVSTTQIDSQLFKHQHGENEVFERDSMEHGQTFEEDPKKEQLLKKEQKKMKLEAFKKEMKKHLDKQTLPDFAHYAMEQCPNNLQEQANVIADLQRQHFEDYYKNVYLQQVIHQRQQYFQLQLLQQQATNMPTDAHAFHNNIYDYTSNNSVENGINENFAEKMSLMKVSNMKDKGSNFEKECKVDVSNGLKSVKGVKMINETTSVELHEAISNEVSSEEENEWDNEDSEFEEINEHLPLLMPVSLWTTNDIEAFKHSYRGSAEHILKVSSLSTASVKVPTIEGSQAITWQFATDSYDIAFGIFFEWNLSPPSEVMVQLNDSSDEEEYDEDSGGDVEKGGGGDEKLCVPMDELVQVVRQDSHLQVQCGKHAFPGRGVYHFKFDNSYSLWRSKSLFYNITYV